MKKMLIAALLAVHFLPGLATAHDSATVYRQVTPDGRVLYSDKVQRGARLDETIAVVPPIKGNLWSTTPPDRSAAPPRMERTPIDRLSTIPPPGRMKSANDAEADVIRAEMLLEEARRKQRIGIEPLPGERTGNLHGGSRLNEAYADRQRMLAEHVVRAEDFLRRMMAERDIVVGRR
ncbi:MAG TPA: hypothetical protein VIM12_18290 [Noviherbaspirillum sp.]|jgi:hypothetical protein|uniref:hypothetical protein n=1 Tax=Noviherbaspirillum sp. TaxID=1926288 RepID=UPI002F93AB19